MPGHGLIFALGIVWQKLVLFLLPAALISNNTLGPQTSPPDGQTLTLKLQEICCEFTDRSSAPTCHALRVYFLEAPTTTTLPNDFVGLLDAIEAGWITVKQQRQPAIRSLRVNNRSQRLGFVLPGTVVFGSWQDRVIATAAWPKANWARSPRKPVRHSRTDS